MFVFDVVNSRGEHKSCPLTEWMAGSLLWGVNYRSRRSSRRGKVAVVEDMAEYFKIKAICSTPVTVKDYEA